MPAVFAEIESYFSAIETEKLCEVSFVGRQTEKDRCLKKDTGNGGLRIQIQGAGATNIQWVANIQTTEVIY
jgi:hypothetical protein